MNRSVIIAWSAASAAIAIALTVLIGATVGFEPDAPQALADAAPAPEPIFMDQAEPAPRWEEDEDEAHEAHEAREHEDDDDRPRRGRERRRHEEEEEDDD